MSKGSGSVFRGAFTALVTPMKDGGIDEPGLQALVDAQIEGGIDGLVPCGTTGESPTLSPAEHVRVVEITMKAARGRVPVLAGAGSNSTDEAIELSRGCKALGVDGTLQITPYYNKPTQEGLAAHFDAITAAVDLPIVVYNVPGRTGVDLQPHTLARLAASNPRVVGVKEATGDMRRAADIREQCGEAFALMSGDDFTIQPFMAVGGDGVISVGSNLVPGLFADLCRAMSEGRWDDARALHYRQLPLTRALFSASSPIPVKTAMARLGRIAPDIRLPLQLLEPSSDAWQQVKAALDSLEITK